jgi:hypothetical protein
MQVIIDRVSDVKQGQYGWSSKIYFGNSSCYINSDGTNLVGSTVDLETTEKYSKAGNKYLVGKVTKALAPAPSSNGNGAAPTNTTTDDTWNNNTGKKVSWDNYRAMAEAAHELAMKLEPDSIRAIELSDPNESLGTTTTIDRSTARAAILNTVMIAYSNGKIFVPAVDDDIPW